MRSTSTATDCTHPEAARRLSEHLSGSPTATEGLLVWCEARGLSSGPITVVRRRPATPPALDAQEQAELAPQAGEPVGYRPVLLLRGDLVLSEADNWFLPRRLPAAMARALQTTDVPFGAIVAPLQPFRRTFRVVIAPAAQDPGVVLEHRAVLLDAHGRPLAVVRERYRAALIGHPVR